MRRGDILGTVSAGRGEDTGMSHSAVRPAGGTCTWCIIMEPTAFPGKTNPLIGWLCNVGYLSQTNYSYSCICGCEP